MGCLWYVIPKCGESLLVLICSLVQRRHKSMHGEAHRIFGDVQGGCYAFASV